jgi:lipopolysaccharide transport system ATP-binding protein
MTSAIRIENLGKCYHINHAEQRLPYKTFRDSITRAVAAPIRRWRAGGHAGIVEQFWALQDLSFDVRPGEVIGIIGRNGAGKSTLLKILSRITPPTIGRVSLYGRVGSLLEVGTGFHPELTGRENIYMNGSILGMSRAEIRLKYDEIVDFSGVEKFLDTPVKRYSSGMQVRLAFAVAAHLDPEILIIDEVLAVGDAEFQKKCLGKMQDVASGGRTILFVSHNMTAVTNLCQRAVVLDEGKRSFDGSVREAITHYGESRPSNDNENKSSLSNHREAWCRQLIRSARIVASESLPVIPLGSSLTVEMEFESFEQPLQSPVMGLVFHCLGKGEVAGVNTRISGYSNCQRDHTSGIFRCRLPRLPFLQGRYYIDVWLGDGSTDLDVLKQYLYFDISPTDYYGSGIPPYSNLGTVMLDAEWEMENRHQTKANGILL